MKNTLIAIAYRNVIRNKGRTVLSGITIAFAMLFFSWMDSLMVGMDNMAIENMIELSTSAVKVTTTEYEDDRESMPLDYGITNREEIEKVILQSDRVDGITARTIFRGQLSNYEDMTPVQGFVIDPKTDETVFGFSEYLEGAYFSDDNVNEIILGQKLAEDFGLGVDSFVTLYALSKYDTRNADDFRIVGLINSTDPGINNSTVLISYEAGDMFLDLEGLVTELNVSLKDRNSFKDLTRDMLEIQTALQAEFPQHTTQTFLELGADFLKMSESKAGFSYMFLLVILFIAAVGIFNTVLMSIYERMREIGILRAHGMKAKELTHLFMYEGVFTGIVGAVLGIILSTMAVAATVYWGYPIDQMAGDMETAASNMPIWGTIYGVWNFPIIFAGAIASIGVATLAAYIPARKAGKLTVTDALRYN